MSEKNDGGQAFPQPMTVGPNDDLYPAYPGMTLRDWFATTIDKDEYGDIISRNLPRETAELLAGAYPTNPGDGQRMQPEKTERMRYRLDCLAWEFRVRAELRYMMADAMLVARNG